MWEGSSDPHGVPRPIYVVVVPGRTEDLLECGQREGQQKTTGRDSSLPVGVICALCVVLRVDICSVAVGGGDSASGSGLGGCFNTIPRIWLEFHAAVR